MIQPTALAVRSCRSAASTVSPVPRFFTTSTLSARAVLRNSNTAASPNATKKLPSAFFASCRAGTARGPVSSAFSVHRHASSVSATASSSTQDALTWNKFLALRKTKRRISLVSSVVCGFIVTAAGLSVLTASDLDSSLAQTLGLDPIAVLGLSTAGLACAGWLVGPMFGNAVFGIVYRGYRPQIVEKERAFYNRIKSHRVDPTNSSIANPVPDYYGEKIGSVADYRRWLKDQRAFNLKRSRGI